MALRLREFLRVIFLPLMLLSFMRMGASVTAAPLLVLVGAVVRRCPVGGAAVRERVLAALPLLPRLGVAVVVAAAAAESPSPTLGVGG
jgi:hypothetical protein